MSPEKARIASLSFALVFILFILLIACWFVLGLVAEESKAKYPWMGKLTYVLGFLGSLAVTGFGLYMRLGPSGLERLMRMIAP